MGVPTSSQDLGAGDEDSRDESVDILSRVLDLVRRDGDARAGTPLRSVSWFARFASVRNAPMYIGPVAVNAKVGNGKLTDSLGGDGAVYRNGKGEGRFSTGENASHNVLGNSSRQPSFAEQEVDATNGGEGDGQEREVEDFIGCVG